MDEQGGAGGVPRKARETARRTDERTAAADTDEASRLDRPENRPDPATGRRRWTSPKAHEEKRGESDA
ncbi:hypothetical protein [Streptomyces sp. NPDC057494]|uniref:hypothetical protein n=1 Tax=Streptomyces sp. NPDC057494 TaxID=3346148 RepID=UPI0036A3CDD1